ncbi:DUF6174 domain-containing protein [Streptomyces sp. NPDC002328]|uniref:DUF6174 domain-containing protein n=1 Tax=Streptomyces sp. NPDC002328 TaxID=3364642 RepID=UPI0036B42FC5
MTAAVHSRPRALSAAVLSGVLLCLTAACDWSASPEPSGTSEPPRAATWSEPAAYLYTLTSSTQVLAGTFRVVVRDGVVTSAVGLDADSRDQLQRLPAEVPTIGALLKMLTQARSEGAHIAEAEYAAGGRPVRITLDPEENAIDDEATFVIDSYEPGPPTLE